MLKDNTQAQQSTFSYWPYGEVKASSGSTSTPFQYVGTLGYYRDSASKTYVRARYLDTQKGRWRSQDPIGFDGGDYNLYRYVRNRPTVYKDPSGRQCPGTDTCALCCTECINCADKIYNECMLRAAQIGLLAAGACILACLPEDPTPLQIQICTVSCGAVGYIAWEIAAHICLAAYSGRRSGCVNLLKECRDGTLPPHGWPSWCGQKPDVC